MNESVILAIVQILSYLYSILLGQIFSGILIITGEGWGKIRGSNGRFAKPHVLFGYAILDAIMCSIIIYVGNSILVDFLVKHFNIVFGLSIELAFASFFWFCHTLSLKTQNTLKRYWKVILTLQTLAILNFFLVYARILP